MSTEPLKEFLREQCKESKLTPRRLSVKAGLSPGTLHYVLKRKYQPTLFTLNQLADSGFEEDLDVD